MEIVVAINELNGIGYNATIPWREPDDMRFFRNLTLAYNDHPNIIIMGRKTFESMKCTPLKGRTNIVISTLKTYEHVYMSRSFTEALDLCKTIEHDHIFIIGGELLYNEAIKNKHCTKVYISKIPNQIQCDAFFSYDDVKTLFKRISTMKLNDRIIVECYEKD